MEILCINLKTSKLAILGGQAALLQKKTDFFWKRSRLRMLNTNSTLLRSVSLRSQLAIFEDKAKNNLHYFRKTLYRRCLTELWICFMSWIYQCSWYGSDSEYARVLNIPGFWICKGSEYTKITQASECVWISLDNSWICLIMFEYARMLNTNSTLFQPVLLRLQFAIFKK